MAITISMHGLISFLDCLTSERVARHLLAEPGERVILRGSQIDRLHKMAQRYATEALDYVLTNGHDRDHTPVSPATVMINATQHAVYDLSAIGLPNEHVTDHGLEALRAATIAVLVWSRITLGHARARNEYLRARGAVGV